MARPPPAPPRGSPASSIGTGRGRASAQLIIEEGWKPLSSPAAGAWLNEYARRARHYALWLTFVTQFFRDFDSEQGRALLANHAIALCLPNERRDLEHARDSLALTDTDIAEITALPSPEGHLLDALHDLQARPRRGPDRSRRPRILDRELQPRARPALPPRRAHARPAGTRGRRSTLLCDPAWHEQLPPGHRQLDAMTAPRPDRAHATPDARLLWLIPRRRRCMIVLAPVVLLAGAGNPPCTPDRARRRPGVPAGLGRRGSRPPTGRRGTAINGDGRHRDRPEPHRRPARVRDRRRPDRDPARRASRTSPPNPFGTRHAFYAGDTGGAIIGTPRRHLRLARPRRPGRLGHPTRHRHPRAEPRHRQPPRRDHPARSRHPARRPQAAAPQGARRTGGPLPLTPGQTAKILPDGTRRRARRTRPRAVKLAIAAGNQIIDKPYIYGGGHGQPLDRSSPPATTARARPASCSTAPACSATTPRTRPSSRATGSPGPASGSPSTPTAPTPSSTSPGSCSTPPGTRRSSRPAPAAGPAGSPPRSSPPNTPAIRPPATAGSSNDTPAGL